MNTSPRGSSEMTSKRNKHERRRLTGGPAVGRRQEPTPAITMPSNSTGRNHIKKMVMAPVQARIVGTHCRTPSSHVRVETSTGTKGIIKVDDIYQRGHGATTLPYEGRVVEDNVASNLPREKIIGLGESHGLSLWLDGSGIMSPNQSDFCAAWCVKPAQPFLKKTETN